MRCAEIKPLDLEKMIGHKRTKNFEPHTKENNPMKEIKTQKILDLYIVRKRKELIDKFNKAEKEILEEDVVYSKVKTHLDEINKELLYNGYDEIKLDLKIYSNNYTDGRLNKLAKEDLVAQDYLTDEVFEIKSMLSACDTYEQEMKVLETYGVVNESGRLVDVSNPTYHMVEETK